MRTLYLDCGMGAAGDMLTAALLELLPERQAFVDKFNSLGLPDVVMRVDAAEKCGITGSHVRMIVGGTEEESCDVPHHHDHHHNYEHDHDHEHHHHHHEHHHEEHTHHHEHRSLADIEAIINGLPLSAKVRDDVLAVYTLIAEAESKAHGKPVTEVHFHEVGMLDAIADICAVCLLIEELAVDKIIASPVHVGSGQVRCAHGILPVPAPATASILQGVPIYSGDIRGELCTPTGAALLRHFVSEFGAMPVLRVSAIGYGMGKKDFPRANCVRAMLGESAEPADKVLEISFNVDDMSGEAIGFAMEQLLAAGAREVFTTAVGMKKSRPGTLITVICREAQREAMLQQIFRHTTTIGVRETLCARHVLRRDIITVDTCLGPVRKKVSQGFGITREKWEYDDLARLAKEHDLSLAEVLSCIEAGILE